eukprot:m.133507 g.133507  ORF g.133507 m.133507 type:complete len:93 (+) comp15951_c0_seq28:300-578(+)
MLEAMAADTGVALGSTNHVLRSCSICLEDDMGDEVAKLLPCDHSFCRGCIRQWLQAAPGCPQCREENIEAFFYQNEVTTSAEKCAAITQAFT